MNNYAISFVIVVVVVVSGVGARVEQKEEGGERERVVGHVVEG